MSDMFEQAFNFGIKSEGPWSKCRGFSNWPGKGICHHVSLPWYLKVSLLAPLLIWLRNIFLRYFFLIAPLNVHAIAVLGHIVRWRLSCDRERRREVRIDVHRDIVGYWSSFPVDRHHPRCRCCHVRLTQTTTVNYWRISTIAAISTKQTGTL